MVSGDVYQIVGKELIISDAEKNELILPKAEMISKDRYKKVSQYVRLSTV
jgi:N utilization substance protein A